MEFNSSHKQEFKRSFPFGVSEVKFVNAQLGEYNGKEYIDVFFCDESGDLEDNVRLFFSTDKAVQFHFNTLKSNLVHNTPDEKKDIARQKIDEVKNTAELVNLLNDKLVGKNMWFTKYFDPTRTHEYQGKTYKNTNKQIYGYAPKEQPELMPKPQSDNTDDGVDEVKQVFPGAKSVDITDDWS